jgi:signal peptidase II
MLSMPSLRRLVSSLLPLVALVGCDHVTKIAAKSQLESQPPRELIRSVLELRYVENTDVGFNLLRWIPDHVRGPLLLVTGAIAIIALATWLLRAKLRPLERAAAVLVLAGALGNYIDRLARGYVVDFIHLRHWPVFNAADIWLSAGLVLLLWSGLRARPGPAVPGGGQPAPSG